MSSLVCFCFFQTETMSSNVSENIWQLPILKKSWWNVYLPVSTAFDFWQDVFRYENTVGSCSQPLTLCSILVTWRHTVCDSITMALTQPLSREGELQGVCWDCISLVLLITCLALLSASCNITWLKKIVCRSCSDFEDLRGNGISVFVLFPHMPQIESEESWRWQCSFVTNAAVTTLFNATVTRQYEIHWSAHPITVFCMFNERKTKLYSSPVL